MRKKLDEEMPDRALFFIWRRVGLLSILLLLSAGVFWFVDASGDTAAQCEKLKIAGGEDQSTYKRRAEDPAMLLLRNGCRSLEKKGG